MIDSEYIILIILAISPVIILLCHMIIVRIINVFKLKTSLQLSLILLVLILNIPYLSLIFFLRPEIVWLLYSFLVFNAIGYSYFHLFNLGETARRIKMLVEIQENEKLSREHFLINYSPEYQIGNRLERLKGMKQVQYKDSKYVLSGKMLWCAAIIINFLRKIYGFV